jgi:hypothetical protein
MMMMIDETPTNNQQQQQTEGICWHTTATEIMKKKWNTNQINREKKHQF